MQQQIQQVTTYNGIVGAVLRQRREQLGVDQGVLAQRLGLTQSSYSRIESGLTSMTLTQLSSMAPHFGSKAEEIFAQIEYTKNDMKQRGVDVRADRSASLGEGVTNVLVGAALLAIVAQILRR